MKCSNCGHQFKVNWRVNCAPGGQEAPGLFFVIGAVFCLIGLVFDIVWDSSWQWGFYAIGGFVWSQCLVAWSDCWGTICPECKQRAHVFPWSF